MGEAGFTTMSEMTLEAIRKFHEHVLVKMVEDVSAFDALRVSINNLCIRSWTPNPVAYNLMMRVMEFQSNDFLCKTECMNYDTSDFPALPLREEAYQACRDVKT